MKLSERTRKTARAMEASASVWDNWEVERWDKLADEIAQLEEFVHLVQSQWEEFGCDDGVVTVKYPWAVQERMRELAKEIPDA